MSTGATTRIGNADFYTTGRNSMTTATIKQKADTIRSHVNSINTLIKELAQQGVVVELSTAPLVSNNATVDIDMLSVRITKNEVY